MQNLMFWMFVLGFKLWIHSSVIFGQLGFGIGNVDQLKYLKMASGHDGMDN